MNTNFKSLTSLIWVVFVDSLGWGIAFSVFAALFFTDHSSMLSDSVTSTSRYMIYESLLAVYSFFMFIFAPVLGGIADHYGRKPGLLISMIGLTVGFILSAAACYNHNLPLLVIGRIISGITAGALSVAQAAVIDISTSKTKSFNLSILMLSNCLGFSLGPVLGGIFVESSIAPVGTTTFLIASLMSFVGLLSVTLFFKETYFPKATSEKFNILKDFSNIKIAFLKPVLNRYLSAVLFSMVAFGLFFSDIPVFMSRQFSANASTTGMVLSVEAILFSMTLMFGGKYIYEYFDKLKSVKITQMMQLSAYLVLSLCIQSFVVNIILFTVISCFAGLMYIGLLTMISDTTEPDWQGRVMGVVAALSSVTWGVGPLLTGAVNHYGPALAFIFSATLMVLGIGVLQDSRLKITTTNKAQDNPAI